VHYVGNLKNVYTMMHGQKNIKLLQHVCGYLVIYLV